MTKPGSGFARRITKANIADFAALLRQKGEPAAADEVEDDDAKTGDATTPTPPKVDPLLGAAKALFKGTSVTFSLPYSKPARAPSSGKAAAKLAAVGATPAGAPALPAAPAAQALAKGPLVWQKVLSATDAQVQKGHATGDLRLSQAQFHSGGKVIDQTTYFREVVFSGGAWHETRKDPFTEQAEFDFDFTVLGIHYGVRRLIVQHKPSGAANQGNYTTNIQWGSLIPIPGVDVTNKTLRLHGTPGTPGPFVIEIV